MNLNDHYFIIFLTKYLFTSFKSFLIVGIRICVIIFWKISSLLFVSWFLFINLSIRVYLFRYSAFVMYKSHLLHTLHINTEIKFVWTSVYVEKYKFKDDHQKIVQYKSANDIKQMALLYEEIRIKKMKKKKKNKENNNEMYMNVNKYFCSECPSHSTSQWHTQLANNGNRIAQDNIKVLKKKKNKNCVEYVI